MLEVVVQLGSALVIGEVVSLARFDTIIYLINRFVAIFIDIDLVETVENGIIVSFLFNFGLVP